MFDVIIPIRSGSTGLKNKNILRFSGDYLVNFLIKKLIRIKLIGRIFILTDSEIYKKKIINHKKINLEYPRPKSLSKKSSLAVDLIEHFIKWADKKKFNLNNILLMQVTSPLLNKNEILKTLNFINKNKIQSLFHVSETLEHPNHIIKGYKKSWKNLIDNYKPKNRQDFIKYYFITGSTYFFKKNFFLKYKRPFNNKSYAFKVDKINFVDIDTKFEFEIAKKLINNKVRN